MEAATLFYIFITILIVSFIIDSFLDYLNSKHFNDALPIELEDVFDNEAYKKSQKYKATNQKFSFLTSLFSLLIIIAFLFFEGFSYVDEFAREISSNSILIALIFFGVILFASDIITLPFSYYQTFVIEERFGFNKTTLKTFILDKVKGWLMLILIGGLILSLIVWFYETVGDLFWIYAWLLVAVFSIFMNMFYSRLIVPLFNKQAPLEDGELRDKISEYANSVGFKLKNIFVIDGSKRSTKANAYFSGFGNEKKITLYDTLIHDLSTTEIVAVLAHEVGHYKKRHIIYNLFFSIALTGLTLFILSLFVSNTVLSEALSINTHSFHVALVSFGLLYSPISGITGLIMNVVSRKFEYQADNFAKTTYNAEPLISALKTLSKNSLSNLTPHPLYVFAHYSHPTLLQRIINLRKKS